MVNTSTPILGANALVAALKLAKVKTIFTLSGNHIMPIFDALLDSDIKLIHTRHEAAAVHMADAYARLTGEVGIALVTGGPGHANAIAALYTAQMAESPVILISGHAPLGQLGTGAFQEMAQADLASPLVKAALTSNSIEAIPFDLAKAIKLAKSGRPGTVHLSLPSDLLEGTYLNASNLPTEQEFTDKETLASSEAIETILQALQAAQRPIILTGPQMQSQARRKQLNALEQALGIPVVGMESPRGINDPCLGAFPEVLAKSDCVLLLGKKLDFTLKFGQFSSFAKDCQFLQLDPEAAEIQRASVSLGKRLQLSVLSDVQSSITLLMKSVIATNFISGSHQAWLQEVKTAINYRPNDWQSATVEPGRVHPAQAFAVLQTILDSHPDSVLISDGGEIGQWAQACLQAPNRIINGVAGSIGSGPPFASAASLVKPNVPIVTVMGDGSFGFHCAEIDTAVRYKLPFLLVIGNDACWNAEHQIQLRDYGQERLIGCDLLPTRYDKVCEGFGGHGELVTELGTLLPATKRALASNLPSCINLMIPSLAAPKMQR
jgi:acetolactate synthase-1/2/3 large subunit